VRTEELIAELAEAPPPRRRPLAPLLGLAVAGGAALVMLVLLTAMTRSPHLAHPGATIAVTVMAALALAVGAFRLALSLARPDGGAQHGPLLAPAALILAAGIAAELGRTPPDAWLARLVGGSPFGCLLSVALLSLPVLAAALAVLRRGAAPRPREAGAAAGLLAGGVTAALYVVHCPEESLLFVAVWHGAAALLVAALGGMIGARLLRW
jgi:hypothetical protein